MTSYNPAKIAVTSYLHNQSAISLKQSQAQGQEPSKKSKSRGSLSPGASPPPGAPVRDAASLKSIKYGPGHEKYPSWPAAQGDFHAEGAPGTGPNAAAAPQTGSSRSKSWADQTHYPKEKPAALARPYNKRSNASFTQQLKTVMERCEKISPETFECRGPMGPPGGGGAGARKTPEVFLPPVDRDGKPLGTEEYSVPSPPERDVSLSLMAEPQLTEADLEEYARTYHDSSHSQIESDYSSCYEDVDISQSHLTRAELEQYTRDCEGRPTHVHQPSYAQSEGYHSYVSSTDSTTTPFLDRLRCDNEAVVGMNESRAGRDSSASSGSSSETLKWHGSLSDVSVSGSSCGGHQQLIAHSAKVQTPQRHHSESVLYLGQANAAWQSNVQRNNQINSQMRKLFPVSTYTVQPSEAVSPRSQPSLSVAERITRLERQQPQQHQQAAQSARYSFLDPDKRHKVPDNSLKAIQKKALLSFYERHHSTWRSEPQLSPTSAPPPQPPPRPRNLNLPSRRSSLADSASGYWKESEDDNGGLSPESHHFKENPRHQHSSSCGSLSTVVLGPLIMGPSISVDDWVPERPPKKPHLRSSFPGSLPQRTPSPDLPPPSPPPVVEDEVFDTDEPLPPPPPEAENPAWNADRTCDSPAPPILPKRTNNFCATDQKKSEVERYYENRDNLQRLANDSSISLANQISKSDESQFYENPDDVKLVEKSRSSPRNVQDVNSGSKLSSILERRKQFEQIEEHSYSNYAILNSLSQSSKNLPGPQVPVERKSSFSRNSIANRNNGVNKRLSNNNSDIAFTSEDIAAVKARENLARKSSVRRDAISKKAMFPAKKPVYQSESSVSRLASAVQKLSTNGTVESASFLPIQKHIEPERSGHGLSRPTNNLGSRAPHLPPTLPAQCPPTQHQISQSKASYLAYRREPRDRERGLPNFEGSYKRTSSPSRINVSINNNNNNSIDNLLTEAEPEKEEVTIQLKPLSAVKCPEAAPARGATTPPTPTSQLGVAPGPGSGVTGGAPLPEHSQTLPKYAESGCRRVARTPRTQSDPSTTRNVQSQSTSSLSKSVSASASDDLLRSQSDVSTVGSSESGYSSSSIAVSSVAPSPTIHPSPSASAAASLEPLPTLALQSQQTKGEAELNSVPQKTCTETQCNLESESESSLAECISEPLKLVQRSEVILRINSSTSDAASQTESSARTPSPNSRTESTSPPLLRPKKQEELECEQLSRDLVSQLPVSDKLHGILGSEKSSAPGPDVKKSTDYVSGLFKLDIVPRSRSSIAIAEQSLPAEQDKISLPDSQENVLPANSTYFTTSECKAKLINLCSQTQSEQENVLGNLHQKKAELVSRLDRKLNVLREEALAVAEEGKMNDLLGENVSKRVNSLARPHESAKFKLHVQEIGHITSLLLGLSGRLARAENALLSLPTDHSDRKTLEEKRDKLLGQLEEAKLLKENIDKRSTSVSAMLYRYLSAEEYADYDHFINMKAKLLIDSREINDKIQLGEEQLLALKETLNESPT
ncbi:unnamed protein product [Bemisia tabaci]|uniref:ASD2 domain-containing protein n=1 Tax=Bemisia tabaci TaxID=7038 RepID=A0A9P0CCV4_BEMTA|nr:unnamed protein product [Bemisia tabaci]